MFLKNQLLIYLFILVLSGCSTVPNFSGLFNLKRLLHNQRQTEKYLEGEEELFNKLVQDIKENRLKKGITKEEILAIYAEPVLTKTISEKDEIREVFYYRHPNELFSTDWAYLYFDRDGLLSSWELKPQ